METNKTATIIDLSHSYQILVKLLKNLFIGRFMDFLNLTTFCIPINLAFSTNHALITIGGFYSANCPCSQNRN